MTDKAAKETRTSSYNTDALDAKLSHLKRLLDSFGASNEHYPGDLCLRGFALHTWENASAALQLVREANFAAGAIACGRAAFEAGEDALLLVTASDFDAADARALVFERLQIADNYRQLMAITGLDPRDPPYYREAQRLEQEAAQWDRTSRGKGKYLLEALAYWRPKLEAACTGKRHPGHWSELTRQGIAKALEQRTGEVGLAKRLGSYYGVFSRLSHPRARTDYSYTHQERIDSTAIPALLGVELVEQALHRRKRHRGIERILLKLETLTLGVSREAGP